MEAYNLEYGDHFTVDEDKGSSVYVYLGDEFDEDTLWAIEVSTMAPFGVNKQDTVTLATKVDGTWQKTRE